MKNFTIYYENSSIMGYETKLEIRFDELQILATDCNWEAKFNPNSDLNYRLIKISKFSIGLNCKNINRFTGMKKSSLQSSI